MVSMYEFYIETISDKTFFMGNILKLYCGVHDCLLSWFFNEIAQQNY